MSKTIIDDRSPEIKAQHKLRHTWETANPVAKQGLRPPPERKNFHDDDSYDEARNSWSLNVGRILALREQMLESREKRLKNEP